MMRSLLLALFALSAQAQQFHFEIPAHAIAHPIAAVKSAATNPGKLHKATFIMSCVGAVASVGLDLASTEYVNKHSYRWYPGQGYVQVDHEDNTFFTTNGQISQPKLIGLKVGEAIIPFAASWLIHDIDPHDSKLIDSIDLAVTGGLSAWYVSAAVQNKRIADANIVYNRQYGK